NGTHPALSRVFVGGSMEPERALSLKEAAQRLGVSYQTIFARRHKIGFRLPGSRIWRVWPSQLAEITRPNYNGTRIAAVGDDRRTLCQSDNVKASGTSISMRRAEKELDTLLERLTKKPRRNTTTA